jgi:hypothetical protein
MCPFGDRQPPCDCSLERPRDHGHRKVACVLSKKGTLPFQGRRLPVSERTQVAALSNLPNVYPTLLNALGPVEVDSLLLGHVHDSSIANTLSNDIPAITPSSVEKVRSAGMVGR